MPPVIAEIICGVGILGLFYLDRDKSVRVSKALWIPVIWLGLVGSRPVSVWLGIGPPAGVNVQLEGTPVDRFIFQLLLAMGLAVLIHRGRRVIPLLRSSWPILLYFFYCLFSVLWSDFPDVSFKRWIKAISDLVMIFVVLTDAEPVAAIERLISRVGFVLLPLSILLIRYFDALGRAYDPDGGQMFTGVTTNKNMLGVITLVISLGTLWRLLAIWRARGEPTHRRHLIAQGVLLTFGVWLLVLANSATSRACFVLGATLMLAMSLPTFRRRPGAVHALMLTILLLGGSIMILGGEAGVVHALGRQTNLTGRTDIWAAVLSAVPNKIVGAGFESFWLGPRLSIIYSKLSRYMHVTEAHNGYLEVYANLGWIGVGLIALLLIVGYGRAVQAFRRDPVLGTFALVYVAAGTIYSTTEAGFRLLGAPWIFLLMGIVAASGVSRGAIATATRRIGISMGEAVESPKKYSSDKPRWPQAEG